MLTLVIRHRDSVPIEAECVCPDRLMPMALADIERLRVWHGNRQTALADHFVVSGDGRDGCVRVEGDCSRVKSLGFGMLSGSLLLTGDAGMHTGARMAGGEITVEGDAGDWIGAEMRGGLIQVRGHAGNLVGAGYRGSFHGMKGGMILVHGNAGHEIGASLRRGIIAIAGDAGDFLAVNAAAGTILVGGRLGRRPGAGMRRATIVALGPTPCLLPTFRNSGRVSPIYLRLLGRYLQSHGFQPAQLLQTQTFLRSCGDMVSMGKGEILSLAP